MSNKYCTYLTVYSGNKLPPFYIGHTSVKKILEGYRGSVGSKLYKSIWVSELKNNPQLFKTKIISLHNTKTEAMKKEIFFQTSFAAHRNPMYINLAICNERFYSDLKQKIRPKNVRDKISRSKKGIPFSKEHRKQISKTRLEKSLSKGHNNPMYGKNHSLEVKENHSKLMKEWYLHNSSPTLGLKRDDLSLRNSQSKGTIWVNKDQKNKQVPRNQIESFLELGWSKGMFR